MQKFVDESVQLQVIALYATQVFCHDHHFPKGQSSNANVVISTLIPVFVDPGHFIHLYVLHVQRGQC